ncbi:VCBS domain-containing protein [Rouxiella chamberiensis]|uniref:VCBS domain-containing protein n=1 Tax=Rouxiella chamberiensis TaxID=1513468 RepID=A0ABY7HSX2_9GAMM|nr:VCBS domain-containing protein [Rouxiella chamberiensis]WAT02496.1 VCBS domain-containing protein [Rouxiella chamberiensis]
MVQRWRQNSADRAAVLRHRYSRRPPGAPNCRFIRKARTTWLTQRRLRRRNSLTDINQYGNHNTASTAQQGDRSILTVDQHGNYNYADALQTGDKSKLLISQSGSGNFVTSTQSANSSLVNVEQVGNGNRAYALQR